jgi:hypothetical protein
MNDDFLSEHRERPRPEFARALRERIDEQGRDGSRAGAGWLVPRWAAGLATAAVLVTLTFSFPGARAAARDFLDLFRIQRFAAVPIDPARIAQLKSGDLDIKALLSDDVEVLKEPGEPLAVESVEAAAQIAGIKARVPTVLPRGTAQPEIFVKGDAGARLTADTAKLRTVMNALEIHDLEVPERLDGASVEVKVPSSVVLKYGRGSDSLTLVQSRSPEIALPEGVDLAQLGEVGLRIAGLSPTEAHTFAQSVDWHSTLLVPVPANAASFREVNVQGATGLLVTTSGSRGGRRSVVLWSDGDMVYALSGGASTSELVEMANSLQ